MFSLRAMLHRDQLWLQFSWLEEDVFLHTSRCLNHLVLILKRRSAGFLRVFFPCGSDAQLRSDPSIAGCMRHGSKDTFGMDQKSKIS